MTQKSRLPTRDTTVREILERVAGEFSVFVDEIHGDYRNKRVVFARHVAIHRLRKRFPYWSYAQIGEAVGLQEHSGVMYALGLLKGKPKILAQVMEAA